MSNLIGPDCSFWQDLDETPRGVDFVKMRAAGAGYVIIRAGQGNGVDPDFQVNWQRAKDAGLPRGSYFYFDSRVAPEAQAEKWIEATGWDLGELPLFADFEETYNGPFKGWQNFKRFVERVQQLVGNHEIGIYTGYYYFNEQVPVAQQQWFAQFPLWIASYPGPPLIPDPWHLWTFHQYTDKGNGAQYGAESNHIDLNYFNGDASSFASRFKISSAPPIPGEPNPKELMSRLYFDGCLYRKMEIRVPYGKTVYHLLKIETAKADFFVSPQVQSRKYVPDFLSAFNLDVAINLDGWTSPPLVTNGFNASEGKGYGPTGVKENIYISKQNVFSRERPSVLWNVLSYQNRLVIDGVIPTINKSLDDIRARSAFGYTKDQKTVYMIAVDGADYDVKSGLNFHDVAKILLDLGCDTAVMFDSGGSTTMAISDVGKPTIINIPWGEDTVARYPGFKLRRVVNVLSAKMKTATIPPPIDPPGEEPMSNYKLINPVKPRPTPAVSGGSDPDLPAGYEFQGVVEADGQPAGTRFVKDAATQKWIILGMYQGKEFARKIVDGEPTPPPAGPVKTHTIETFNDGTISIDRGPAF